MKSIRKFFYTALAVMMIGTSGISIVKAANTYDSNFGDTRERTKYYGGRTIYVNPAYTYKDENGNTKCAWQKASSEKREKTNNSYVYVFVTDCKQGSKIPGRGDTPSWCNKLYVDTKCLNKNGKEVYCGYNKATNTERRREFSTGKQYFLTNWAYEQFGNTLTFLEFTNGKGYGYTLGGYWSPDSVGNYTIL
ncbi:hypothetical protein [Ruminococcus sp. HUN007]|uniref:hypothetical protein n=1 Tax=Ruminococcus sp. HUN007 TaxID=1514668 RepID=UPI0005D147FD|nr:hypothetical protein [Ruminococcus sp. HUN007]